MHYRYYFTAFIPLFLISINSACDAESVNVVLNSDNQTQNDNQISPTRLALNQPYRLSEQLQLSLLNIKEDSRCPHKMTCIISGRVIAEFEINNTINNKRETVQLTLSPAQENLAMKVFNGYVIKLIDVEPRPEVGKNFQPQDYSVKIITYKADQ